MTATEPQDRYLTTAEAASFTGFSHRTLAAWRSRGSGPAYSMVNNRARYRFRDLTAFMEARRQANEG